MSRVIAAFAQFFDDTGAPLENGWLEFLVSGTTATQKDTYSDIDFSIPNSNPVQLDAAGRCPNVFGTGRYKVKSYVNNPVTKAPGALIQEFDPVFSDFNPLSADAQFAEWDFDTIYSAGNIVTYQQNYYKAILSANQGNVPSLTSAYWEEIDFIHFWNANQTYSLDEVVVDAGAIYFSLQDNNINHTPLTSPTWWQPVGSGTVLLNWEENGTTFRPVVSGYNIGGTANLVGNVYLQDNANLYIGNSQDLNITHTGIDALVQNDTGNINLINTNVTGLIAFYTNNTARWAFDANGHLIPASNNVYDIGNGTTHIRHSYHGGSGRSYYGGSQESSIYFDGTDLIVDVTSGDLILKTTGGGDVYLNSDDTIDFQIDSITRWIITNSGHLIPSTDNVRVIGDPSYTVNSIYVGGTGALYVGSSQEWFMSSVSATLSSLTSNGQPCQIGTTSDHYAGFKVNNALRWYVEESSDDYAFAPNVDATYYLGTSTRQIRGMYISGSASGIGGIYLGNNSDAHIFQNSGLYLYVDGYATYWGTESAHSAYIVSNGTARWQVDSSGDILPIVSNTYAIGSTSAQISKIHVTATGGVILGAAEILKLYYNSSVSYLVSDGYTMRIEATGSNNDVVLYVNGTAALRCDESTNRVELDSAYKVVSAWAYNNTRSGRVQMVDSSGIFGYQSSSKKYKENIKKLKDEGFDSKIDLFEPVTFNYKPELTGGDGSEEFGLIAEDVEKIDPRLCFYDELPDGKKEVAGIHFHALHAYEIDELQKLRARVLELETQVAALAA